MPIHAERRIVPYLPHQIFDLVSDVEKYPEFLPWCIATRIRNRSDCEILADMTIGFGPFRETFITRDILERPERIKVRYERGPFKYLNNDWEFRPDPLGTEVGFFVDFDLRSRMLQAAIGAVFNEAVRRMVNAFQRRARDVYGPPIVGVADPSS
jgi:coenzyme Q-binding protein COQ10